MIARIISSYFEVQQQPLRIYHRGSNIFILRATAAVTPDINSKHQFFVMDEDKYIKPHRRKCDIMSHPRWDRRLWMILLIMCHIVLCTTGFSPTGQPSQQPSQQPSRQPSSMPTRQPSVQPTHQPTQQPTHVPTQQPTRQPTRQPSTQPTRNPTNPTGQPTRRPSRSPSNQPTRQPTRQPISQPSKWPSGLPTGQPSQQPTCQPTSHPTANQADTGIRVGLAIGTAVPTFIAVVLAAAVALLTISAIAANPGGLGVYLLDNWGIQVDLLLTMHGGDYAKLVDFTPEAVALPTAHPPQGATTPPTFIA